MRLQAPGDFFPASLASIGREALRYLFGASDDYVSFIERFSFFQRLVSRPGRFDDGRSRG